MRILRHLSRLFVLLLMGTTFIAPALAPAHAALGRERGAPRVAADHHHAEHGAHDHAAMALDAGAASGMPHEHSDAPSDAPCTAGCCLTGMACCTAVLAEPVAVRARSAERIVRTSTMTALSGIDPDVPLKPPRSER